MDVKKITISKEEAKQEYEKYLEIVKVHKERIYEDLKKAYHALSQGNQVIDIFTAFKKTGVNEQGEPKLAISLAGEREVFFHKQDGGAGRFSDRESRWNGTIADVALPDGTFKRWETEKATYGGLRIKRQSIVTKVPPVPAEFVPERGNLNNYYVLWEVDEWVESEAVAAAKDPILLRRINANTFIVFAAWDLTPVEQSIMRGR